MSPDQVQSIFSLVELDFSVPFTEQGLPPEHLEKIFVKYLLRIVEEEQPKWIQWGAHIVSRNRVCIQIGPLNITDNVCVLTL